MERGERERKREREAERERERERDKTINTVRMVVTVSVIYI